MSELLMMAFAAGSEAATFTPQPVYTGIMPIQIVAINPTKEELGKLQNRVIEKDLVYLDKDPNTGTARLRLDFYVQSTKESDVDVLSKFAIWVTPEKRFNADKSKVQVVNPYGQFAWVTKEQMETNTPPENFPNFLMEDVRPAFVGEERLTMLLQTAINIPRVINFEGNVIANKQDALSRMDDIKAMATTGNIKELKSYMASMKIFKMLAGARITEDNRVFQDWFVDVPIRGGARNVDFVAKRLANVQEFGGYKNTNFGPSDFELRDFTLTPTNPSEVTAATDVEDDW